MEVHDDRPVSVYDNLKTPPPSIQTSTPKVVKSDKTVPTSTKSPLPTSTTTEAAAAAAPTGTITANRATSSPIYTDISFKFNETKQLKTNQESQQPFLQQQQQQLQSTPQQQTLPCASQQYPPQPALQPVASNITDQTTPTTLQFAANTTPPSNSDSSIQAQANPLITMPTLAPIRADVTATATPTAASTTATTAARNATPTQRPLSQHSQSEHYEASQSIAAVKAALNDAKSKFFGLNGYAQDHQHNAPQTNIDNLMHSPNPNNSNESRLKQQTAIPRLLIDNQYPKVQIVTTAPTPPPKSPPKYQNIPENSAIFRNSKATPPERPPKPVEAIATPSRMTVTTLPTQPDGIVSTSPNSAVFSSNSAHSNTPSPSPTSPLDGAKISLSHSHAAYKPIPLNDIDITQPSQAVYMSTTVPQNIKGSKIAGRHTPTRNSLRHSRMLVVNNKTYPATQHPNPMNFKYPNLARWLLILEIIVGLLISFLAIWIFCLAPNTAIQYNPYWSGLVLLLAGILGLVLVRYQRIKRHKVRENCFKFLRANSYLLALLAILLCCVALFCAALHYARLCADDTRCAPTNILEELGSCTCTFNVDDEVTASATNSSAAQVANGLLDEEVVPEVFNDQSYKVEYRDLSCKEVRGEWITILVLSTALNSIGFVLACGYAVLLFCCRHGEQRPFYSSVQTTSTF
ncbi:mucin-2 isoform X1 [Anastrepha obliqua]|uniref:mucin-2 isoform X1 n=1 Tax=Anastrepha obliqua TaxID=95512 RepID=UPI002409A840|nr:mucin-2 isoform X1 [Anastrepha obliqua]XP_054728347.1 mucin-2 isoform X1 [Anastrepha obliqua]